jgi:hypothetical protein
MPDRPIPPTPMPRKSRTPWVIVAVMAAAVVVLILIGTGQFTSNSQGLRLIPPQQTSEAPADTNTPKAE